MTNFYSYLNKTGAYREILYVPGGTKVVVRILAQPKGGGNGVGGGWGMCGCWGHGQPENYEIYIRVSDITVN